MNDTHRVDALAKAHAQLKTAIKKLPKPEAVAALGVLGKIHDRLESAPFDFGEELYNLKSLGMQIRLGVQIPIAIQFGADEKSRLVVIQSVVILQ